MSNPDDSELGLIDHLTELRSCLKWALLFVAGGFLLSWGFSEKIFDFMRAPIEPFLNPSAGGLVFTAPMDKFIAHIKVSALSGIIISCPFWLYQVWRFVAPGLYKSEKRYAVGFLSFGTALFLTGVSFVYFVVYPMAFDLSLIHI